jgi:hypothetical protein
MNIKKEAMVLLTIVTMISGSFSLLNAADSAGISGTVTTLGEVASTKPNAPSNLRLTTSGTSVTATWRDNSNNEDGFIVCYKDPNNGWQYKRVRANTTSYTANNLKRGKSYPFVIFAFNTAGKTHASAKYIVVGE